MRSLANTLAAALLLLTTLSARGENHPSPPKPGADFQSADLQALARDDFANPAMLWVEQGRKLWDTPRGQAAKRCADCHREPELSMRGVAARYPAFDREAKRVINLDMRINHCATKHQRAPAWAYESPELLSLSALLAIQSRGSEIKVVIDGNAASTYARGKALYHERIGQMNLSCANCHDKQWGKTLLNETISQGQPDGWPAYRLEWQSLGSLQRRLRACFFGVRAEQPALGAEELVALELYLAHRAKGLRGQAPGVRR